MFIINCFNFVLLYFVRCNGFRTLQRFNVSRETLYCLYQFSQRLLYWYSVTA